MTSPSKAMLHLYREAGTSPGRGDDLGEGYRAAAHARAMAERILPGVEIRDEETE